jgi:predicted PurR-regulated permease PerM
MGTAAQIHPALIVFALVTGEYMAGIAGALLAVPIFSILQTLFLSLKALAEELEPKPFKDVPREIAGD